jgi:hypothetical protein
MKSLIFIISLLLLGACSKSTTSTKLKITSNFIFGGTSLFGVETAGGLMVWGQGPGGEAFGRAMVGTDTINIDLKNGAWTFYGMAWEVGASGNLAGKPRCAKSTISLAGEAVAVNLNLTNENCADPVFGNSIHQGGAEVSLAQTKVEWCGTSPSLVTTYTDKCTDDTTDIDREAAKGHGTSYRYRMRSFERKGGSTSFLADEIASICLNGSNSSSPLHSDTTALMPGLPVGLGSSTPFHISMDVYLQSMNCESSIPVGDKKGAVTIELPHGLQSPQPRLKYIVDTSMAPAKNKIYVQLSEADICNGRTTGSATYPYAGGQGTEERPYLICSGEQFLKLPVTSSSMHYKLLTDINLAPFAKGLATQGTESYFSSVCLGTGSNFLPIGMNNSCIQTNIFTGSLDGNNHSVTGLRIDLPSQEYVGLFSKIMNPGYVRNLNLVNPEVIGRSNVGALAGWSNSTDTSGINVQDANIEAGINVNEAISVSFSNVSGNTCSLTPTLPAGVTLNTGTCILSGAPTGVFPSTTVFTVTVTDTDGSTSEVLFKLGVDSAAPFLNYTGHNVGKAGEFISISPSVLMHNGSAIANCLVSPPLPAGLGINPNSCVISGTPSGPAPSIDYYVTAENSAGLSVPAHITLAICPDGYLKVSENPSLGVGNFCVAKFEMKCVGASCPAVAPGINAVATSQATLIPWVNINQVNAKSACTTLGLNYDLISNPEWMTIAYLIESNPSNWTGGSMGSGMLYRGHSDGTPSSSVAVTDTADHYNGTSGNHIGQAAGSGKEQRRTHLLPNGEIIWDFAGNVWEWVDWSLGGALSPGPTSCSATWTELPLVSCGGLAAADFMTSNPSGVNANDYNSTYGLGQFIGGGGTGGAARRGGYWAATNYSGIFSLDLSQLNSVQQTGTGFRCVYRP